MSSLPSPRISPEEYFVIERSAEFKSDYWYGEMFAMAGCSPAHDRITMETAYNLRRRLDNSDCEVFSADMKVRLSEHAYCYPDLSVACDAKFGNEEYTLLNPTFMVEVLSPSTEAYDRGRKAEAYRRIPSLRQYLLISQDRMLVESYTRADADTWILKSTSEPEAVVQISALGIELPVAEIYRRVKF